MPRPLPDDDAPPRITARWWKLAAAAVGLVALGLAIRASGLGDKLEPVLEWIDGLGPWGPAIFVVVYALATVLLVPGSALTLGAGAIFGLGWGFAWSSVASTLGAGAAFLVGRHLARGWVEKRIEGNPQFEAVDEAVAREGWKIVALTRLSPLFPFTFLNYAFSLTRVRFWPYLPASWVAMAPGTLLYVYLGFLARESATGTATKPGDPLRYIAYAVGLVATIAVTAYVPRLARKALAARQ